MRLMVNGKLWEWLILWNPQYNFCPFILSIAIDNSAFVDLDKLYPFPDSELVVSSDYIKDHHMQGSVPSLSSTAVKTHSLLCLKFDFGWRALWWRSSALDLFLLAYCWPPLRPCPERHMPESSIPIILRRRMRRWWRMPVSSLIKSVTVMLCHCSQHWKCSFHRILFVIT